MSESNDRPCTGRREFLSSAAAAACLYCLGARNLLAQTVEDSTDFESVDTHNFLKDSHMTYEEVLKYAYASWFIPAMKVLAEDMGQHALEMTLRKSTSEAVRRIITERFKNSTDNSLTAFARIFEKPNHILEHAANYEIVENNGHVLELKVSECLWAKVFRDADAAGIGYAYICFADYATAQAFNPGIVLHRSKTIMQGDTYCDHRYEMTL
jgi:hypothetical protein